MMRRSLFLLTLTLAASACGSAAENAVSTLIEQVRLGDQRAAATYEENKELIDSAEVRPIWIEALRADESPAVRTWAAEILGASGDASALPELVAAMSSEREVRDAAVDAIRSFPTEQAAAAFADALRNGNRDAQVTSLGQIARLGGDTATEAVVAAARSGDDLVSKTAVNTLGDLATDAAAAALGALIIDAALDPQLRTSAVSNLGRIESSAASDHLAAAIEILTGQAGAEELLAAAQQLQR